MEQQLYTIAVDMVFSSMKEAKIYCKKMSKRQNFALVVIDSADTTEAGRLALACKHHSSPRNTRKENLVQDIVKYDKNTEQLIKAELANNDKIFEQMKKINESLAEENESMVKVKVEGGDALVNVNVADGDATVEEKKGRKQENV